MAKAERKPIGKKLRFEVFKRDGFVCQYCGAHPPAAILHVDHIVPVAEGGGNEIENLITSCQPCNLGKGPRPLNVKPASAGFDVEIAREREEQARGYAEVMLARREREEEEAWIVADVFVARFSLNEGIRRDYLESIRQFNEKLGVYETTRAMEIACANAPHSQQRTFRYFCGVCWNKIRGGR